MRKLLDLIVGVGIGLLAGGITALFFAPATGERFQARLRSHYANALEAARKAAQQRRIELEEELKRLGP